MKLQPLGDRIIIKRIEQEVSSGGIILAKKEGDKPFYGEVLAVGPGILDKNGARIEIGVEVGDLVYFAQFGGIDIDFQGENIIIIREGEVLGKEV